MAVPAAAIIGAAAAVGGAGINAAAQGKMNKRTERYNKWAMAQQREWSLQDWERQNQYNSPAQQMQRLREAGLNPHLIYGGGQPTNTASAIQGTNINPWNPKAPDVGAILTNPVNAYLETRSFQAQQKKIDAETLKTLADIDLKQFDFKQKEALNTWVMQLMEANVQGRQIENELNRDENIRRNLQTSSSLSEAVARMSKMVTENELNKMMLQKGNEEIKNISQMRRKVEEEINNLIKDGKIKQFEIQLNNAGFTKSDPVYFRLGKIVIDKLLGNDVTAELSDVLKNSGEKGEKIKKAIKSIFSWNFWLGESVQKFFNLK